MMMAKSSLNHIFIHNPIVLKNKNKIRDLFKVKLYTNRFETKKDRERDIC